MDDVHFSVSPFVLEVTPGEVSASRTFAMGLDKDGRPVHPLLRSDENKHVLLWRWNAGESNLFTINPRDSFGNKVKYFDYQHLAFNHNLTMYAPLKMRSEILEDGRLVVSANTTSTMPMRLFILYKNEPILNSPIDIQITPGDAHLEHTSVHGTGLIDSYIGKQSEVIIRAHDVWGNPAPTAFLSATCHSPNCSLAIENHRNGTFSVLFTPYKKEIIQLSVRMNGMALPFSPFHIQVKARQFPTPPLLWNFLGPFDQEFCQDSRQPSVLQSLGLCDFGSFQSKVLTSTRSEYPSTLLRSGIVTWRLTSINASGHARVRTTGTDFFGWAVRFSSLGSLYWFLI